MLIRYYMFLFKNILFKYNPINIFIKLATVSCFSSVTSFASFFSTSSSFFSTSSAVTFCLATTSTAASARSSPTPPQRFLRAPLRVPCRASWGLCASPSASPFCSLLSLPVAKISLFVACPGVLQTSLEEYRVVRTLDAVHSFASLLIRFVRFQCFRFPPFILLRVVLVLLCKSLSAARRQTLYFCLGPGLCLLECGFGPVLC